MKKILCMVMALAMVLCLVACGGEKADYVIATDKGFSPFEFQNADGDIVGIDMDILKAIAEDQGFTYELQYIGWDAAIAACQAGHSQKVTMMQLKEWQLRLILILQALLI